MVPQERHLAALDARHFPRFSHLQNIKFYYHLVHFYAEVLWIKYGLELTGQQWDLEFHRNLTWKEITFSTLWTRNFQET